MDNYLISVRIWKVIRNNNFLPWEQDRAADMAALYQETIYQATTALGAASAQGAVADGAISDEIATVNGGVMCGSYAVD
jgi:hypothetical protein